MNLQALIEFINRFYSLRAIEAHQDNGLHSIAVNFISDWLTIGVDLENAFLQIGVIAKMLQGSKYTKKKFGKGGHVCLFGFLCVGWIFWCINKLLVTLFVNYEYELRIYNDFFGLYATFIGIVLRSEYYDHLYKYTKEL